MFKLIRPTHDAIDKLATQVSSLTTFLGAVAELPPDSAAWALARYKRDGSMDLSTVPPVQAGTATTGVVTPTGSTATGARKMHSRLRYGQRGQVSAHGPTSAFFDDPGASALGGSQLDGADLPPEDYLREQATAKCAEERHLEVMHAVSGRIDCECNQDELMKSTGFPLIWECTCWACTGTGSTLDS